MYMTESEIVKIASEWVQNLSVSVSYNCFTEMTHLNILQLAPLVYNRDSNQVVKWLLLLMIFSVNWLA